MTDSARTESNRSIVTDFIDLFYTQHRVKEAFEKYVEPSYIQHNPMAADGRDAAIDILVPMFAEPGVGHDLKRIIVDGDFAALHVHVVNGDGDRGTSVIDIYRLANGKLAEHWDVIQPVPAASNNGHPMF